ncbi:hypothetical protein [Niallia sp. Krafla_26]|uniref:hypothetical protein n=1 Tax=Niallia sp. Krafla_26 TaxID=3064703 RepID=UPI003D172F7D
MDNFNSYANPYSYQKNPYGYYGNLPKQQPNYSSSPFNHVRMNKEENQTKSKSIERNKTSKPTIYTNEHIDKITGTRPVIFSAPEVGSIQLFEKTVEIETEKNEHTFKENKRDEDIKQERSSSLMNDFLDELYEESNIENSSDEEAIDDEIHVTEPGTSEHLDEEIEESTSTMEENHHRLLNDYLSMLDESQELLDESQDLLEESQELLDESHEPLDENHELLDENHELLDENHELLDENHELLDVNHGLLDESHELLDENHELFDENHELLDENHELLDENHELLDENHGLLDENHGLLDENHGLLDESHELLDENHELLDENHELLDENHELLDENHELLDENHELLDENHELLDENQVALHSEEDLKESSEDQNFFLEDAFYQMLSEEESEELLEHNHSSDSDHQEKLDLNTSEEQSNSKEDSAVSLEEELYAHLKDQKSLEDKFSSMLEDVYSEQPQEIVEDHIEFELSATEKEIEIEKELKPITPENNQDSKSNTEQDCLLQDQSAKKPEEVGKKKIHLKRKKQYKKKKHFHIENPIKEELYDHLKDQKSLEDKYSSMLEDVYSEQPQEIVEDHNDFELSATEKEIEIEKELKPITPENNQDSKSNTEQDCLLQDQSANKPEEVGNKRSHANRKKQFKKKKHFHVENLIKEPLLEDKPHPKVSKKELRHHVVEKKQPIIVKMPVLLGQLDLDVTIVQTLHLMLPIDHISKIEWSIQSLDCKVVPPSTTVFLKGVLIADIEFIHKGLNHTIHSLKVPIPWSKITNIHWLALPDLPQHRQNEFMFHSQHDERSHFEDFQKFAEPIKSQLKQINFVWHQELETMDTKQKIDFQGTTHLTIDISQEQYINLEN